MHAYQFPAENIFYVLERKLNFEKISRQQKSMQNYPVGKEMQHSDAIHLGLHCFSKHIYLLAYMFPLQKCIYSMYQCLAPEGQNYQIVIQFGIKIVYDS